MELNADGQRLLDNIAPALDVLTMAVEEVQKDSNQLRLRLSVLPLFASQRLFPRMGELRRQHPNLHLDVETTPHSISRLGEGLDAAIVLAQDVDPSLYAHQLDHDEVYLIAARDQIGRASCRERVCQSGWISVFAGSLKKKKKKNK